MAEGHGRCGRLHLDGLRLEKVVPLREQGHLDAGRALTRGGEDARAVGKHGLGSTRESPPQTVREGVLEGDAGRDGRREERAGGDCTWSKSVTAEIEPSDVVSCICRV